MDRYKQMAILAAVVDAGSMSRAAAHLGMTPSGISQHIRALERSTGVTLLRRSTRQLTLTEAGEAFYEGCRAMLDAARDAEDRLAELRDEPVGELSISAPVGIAAHHLTHALAPVLAARGLSLRLHITDDHVDLIDSRIDLALGIGPMRSSTFIVHHLAEWDCVICASPHYLQRRGTPNSPAALAHHDWLLHSRHRHTHKELIGPIGQRRRIEISRRVISNNQLSLKQLALAGAGLTFQLLPEIASDLAENRLVRVLPKWSAQPQSIVILLPPRSRQPAKVRFAIETLATYFSAIASHKRPPRPTSHHNARARTA